MISEENSYTRINGTDNFGIYLGLDNDGRTSMFVKLSRKPVINFKNTHLIYDYNKRNDGLWALTVSINEHKYTGVFHKLVYDLVDMVRDSNNHIIAERLFLRRFIEWKTLFEESINLEMNFNEVVGLAGELYFLKEFMFERYGVKNSLLAWCGPNGSDKDFILNKVWFEIKTKSFNKKVIHLSNENQLQSKDIGYLTIISYEKSSLTNLESTNLIKLYESICDLISSQSLRIEFDKKLISLNFLPDSKYQDINLEFKEIEFYEINEVFPKVDTGVLHEAITNIKYDLFLPAIKNFRVEL